MSAYKRALPEVPEWCEEGAVADTTIIYTQPLTKFERAAVVARRAEDLAQGAVSKVVMTPTASVLKTACEEIDAGVALPLTVLRYLPDGRHVERPLSSLRPDRHRVRTW